MTTNNRRVAADARRIAREAGVGGREQTAQIRDLVRRNYIRGVEDGRSAEREENSAIHPRIVLLHSAADILDAMRERSAEIPNSIRSVGAFKEASSILRDAAERGEAANG